MKQLVPSHRNALQFDWPRDKYMYVSMYLNSGLVKFGWISFKCQLSHWFPIEQNGNIRKTELGRKVGCRVIDTGE